MLRASTLAVRSALASRQEKCPWTFLNCSCPTEGPGTNTTSSACCHLLSNDLSTSSALQGWEAEALAEVGDGGFTSQEFEVQQQLGRLSWVQESPRESPLQAGRTVAPEQACMCLRQLRD